MWTASKSVRAPSPGWRDKAKLAGSVSDIMQVKGKKLIQGVSMKSLKGAYFEVEIQGKLQ